MIDDRKEKTISIDSTLSSGTVRSRVTVSKDLKKYFRHLTFFSSYDAQIIANNSILDIPVLSTILPLAWITGADVYVDELDGTFAESMDAVQREYKKIYSGAPFVTRLHADRLVANKITTKKTALLFSGGLDSTYSLFRNMNLKPMLIMIFGTFDIPMSNFEFQKTLEREYSDFAKREGLTLSFVRTNAFEILDTNRVNRLFWKLQGLEVGFWERLGYSLCYIGQTAPLSIDKFSRLLMAGALDETSLRDERMRREYPDASYTDEKIMWANFRVEPDWTIHRYEKAFALKKWFDSHKLKLRPCLFAYGQLRHSDQLNCNRCSKCLMTIAELLFAGIDPRECGLSVDQATFDRMRVFQNKLLSHQDITLWWKPLQQAIPNEFEEGPFSAKQFFEWLKTVNLDSSARQHRRLYFLYQRLPCWAANLSKMFWEKPLVQYLLPRFLRSRVQG